MSFRTRMLSGVLVSLVGMSCAPEAPAVSSEGRVVGSFRVATFNASLNRAREGRLHEDLRSGTDEQIQNCAEIIQRTRPDVLLVNEFDYDAEHASACVDLFRQKYLEVSQHGTASIMYPYAYIAPVNTGVASGHDLDRNGIVEKLPGSRLYGNDAFGYGEFPGQYGMLVLSRFPIDAGRVRTFQKVLWKDMPGAKLPVKPDSGEAWYDEATLKDLRLSSKSHWDLPLRVNGRTVHLLASHPTPPAFDGPERRNAARNHDEVRFWVDYLSTVPGAASYIRDDKGLPGGIDRDATFVVVGDLNADAIDGNGNQAAIRALVNHPQIVKYPAPTSTGAEADGKAQGGANAFHVAPLNVCTADFSEPSPGNLRVDYVLPSANCRVTSCGVYWPAEGEAGRRLVEMKPKPASSDHRLVWADVVVR